MATLIYGRPSDLIAGQAIPSVQSGTEDPDYPAANLADQNPAKPAKLTTPTGAWLLDFGTAKSVDLVALIHHNLDQGLDVRIQANSSNSWATPPLDQAITIPADHEDGYPVNPFVDLTGISPRSYQYWRLAVVGTNSAAVAVGELVIVGTKRTLEVNLSWGATDEEEHPVIEHRTEYGVVTTYDLSVKWRRLVGEVDTTDAGAASLQALMRDARGRARAFLIVPDPDQNDAWLVRLAAPKWTRRLQFLGRHIIGVEFEEISRGLPL